MNLLKFPFPGTRMKRAMLSVCLLALCLSAANSITDAADPVELKETDQQKWYKGNLHTHSLWSDGDDYLEMIADWYKTRGYDFLSFTDHNVLSTSERWTVPEKNKGKLHAYEELKKRFPDWIEERTNKDGQIEVRLRTFEEVSEKLGEPGKFLLILSEEVTDRYKNMPVHMNATNLHSLLTPRGGQSVYEVMQNNTNALLAQRERSGKSMMIHLNHPNFHYGVTAEELMKVIGENFFEVYNGHPGVNNKGDEAHASTERIWDIILTKRLAELKLPMMYGLGTDDGHNYHKIPSRASEPGRGWVVVLSETLEPEALVDAMEAGRFYASSGVKLKSVTYSDKGVQVEVDPEEGVDYTIEFIGTREGYPKRGIPVLDSKGQEQHATKRYSNKIGETLKTVKGPSASYDFDGKEIYVRAVVHSSKLHPNPAQLGEVERAWVQPVVGPAAPKQ
ncbi:CehA/McbA family metallohydrolase domain-containing protein [Gimesia panareensis]|uniref:hypothetical protein n=1 Tax=Gimesia panareensis TaxID=2527978 RepID=UPI00118C91F4|nr:hypothetical protein [Gimesia panareensis]QDU51590.1 hypothetical protein Pan110_39560 [Gimesia panareensis]